MNLNGAVDEDGPHPIAHGRLPERVPGRAFSRPAAQLRLVRLSDCGQRDLVDDLDVLGGGGPLGHVGDRPGFELVGGEAAPARERDVRDGDLAGVRVGPTDGGHSGDRRVLEQRILDRRGIEVVAAADDQVLGAPGEPDEPIRVHGGQVAGVEPVVHDLAVGAQLRVGVASDEVAGEAVGTAEYERPDLAVRQERPLAGDLVDGDSARLLVGQALPYRSLAGSVGPAERAGTRALGQAIAFA